MLVFGKAAAIFQQLHECMSTDYWAFELAFAAEFIPSTPEGAKVLEEVPNSIRKCASRLLSYYQMRILDFIDGFPMSLLWIGKSLPHVQCEDRSGTHTHCKNT